MLTIRLARGGAKNSPRYRIVVIEKTKKREGNPVDILGYWHPAQDEVKIDKNKLNAWLEKGAKTSLRVEKLLKK